MVALRGGNLFAKVGSISGLIGTLFPALLLIVFGIIWLAIGEPVQTSLHASALLPPWTGIASIVLIVSMCSPTRVWRSMPCMPTTWSIRDVNSHAPLH